MKKSNVVKLKKKLYELALAVIHLVKENIDKKVLIPTADQYFRWVLDEFEYTDAGITKSRAHGEYFTKKSWARAIIKLDKSIEKLTEYKKLQRRLNKFKLDIGASQILRQFVGKIIDTYLDNQKIEKNQINRLISILLKEIEGKPVNYGAEVDLYGVVLRSSLIKIKNRVTLRKVKKEDLEKESLTLFPIGIQRQFLPSHTAILDIEFLGRQANEIQKKVNKAIGILRLFKVGSIKYSSYRMLSESVIDVMARGTLTSGDKETSLEKYLITKKEEKKLIKFWRLLEESLPKSFIGFDTSEIDNKTIAYNRYSDSLLHNGVIERRIANVVMGLEALFMTDSKELSYKLQTRVSRLLGLLGYDSIKIREVIKDAYGVRSKFAHGDQLSKKERLRLEKKYGDIKNLLLQVLDYLRISIITVLIYNKEKEKLIKQIDNSLIDKKKATELENSISRLSLGEIL